jgi:hypothetical protein
MFLAVGAETLKPVFIPPPVIVFEEHSEALFRIAGVHCLPQGGVIMFLEPFEAFLLHLLDNLSGLEQDAFDFLALCIARLNSITRSALPLEFAATSTRATRYA